MTQPLFPGNQTNFLSWFRGERVEFMPKVWAYHAMGYALITTAPQTQIDIFVPSHSRDISDLPLIVPAGARVYWISLRVPKPITLVGTTGDRLKVGTAHTDVNPNIAVASSAIAGGSSAQAAAVPFDTLAAPLGTLGGSTQYRLYCSNAGNTAAGSGISVASGVNPTLSRVVVDVCYLVPGIPSRLENLGYQSSY
ncbi:MAG: hypothetical protein RMZ41_003250 [Nostoc sp. DedVER02]|uniref:hypothetical protein n=1 Tax=unclassified Nostoc TaxID=2593658 RepID=UPI002AD54FAD|nr:MULTISPECIES: hypothetical protein [unclassified Nostoc]MDZ7986827.1 hypothetical protein [Nostoc sp. DedVER02]MDZ8115729.1 hypothetical protein [Nostoc sp. DedVER01b]